MSNSTRIYIIRHGERCDSVRADFVGDNFDAHGTYSPTNLNLPESVPRRSDGYQSFNQDTPLTEIGIFTASLLGKSYRNKGISVDRVYCSPSLRCVQTCQGFLKGYGNSLPVIIEPGLFEWMGFTVYQNGHPSWMTEEDFKNMGVNIIPNTDQIYTPDQIVPEDVHEYYVRSEKVTRTIFDRHPGERILFFAHSTTHDACFRLISGGSSRTKEQFIHVLRATEFLGNIEIVKDGNGKVTCNGCPVPPLTIHVVNPYFDKILTMSDEELAEDLAKKDISSGFAPQPREDKGRTSP